MTIGYLVVGIFLLTVGVGDVTEAVGTSCLGCPLTESNGILHCVCHGEDMDDERHVGYAEVAVGVIDYAKERDKTLKKQEERISAIEEKVIRYVAETMSPYISKDGLNQLIENIINFIHMSFKPDFSGSCSVKVSAALSTTDLMHFGWNIAKPFRKPCAHTALFLKQVFAETFRNTEPETIEKKLRLNPLQGNIKINKDICGNCQSDVKSHTDETIKSESGSDSKQYDAKRVALADMLQEEIPLLVCDGEEDLIDEEEVA